MTIRPEDASQAAIDAFLAEGGYANVEEWMEDSGYIQVNGAWIDSQYEDPKDEEVTFYDGPEVNPLNAIEGAMEACGWNDDPDLEPPRWMLLDIAPIETDNK